MSSISKTKRNKEVTQNDDGSLKKNWTEKNAFIWHSTTKCAENHYTPKHRGKQTEKIIRDTLEALLWDLLNSAWFTMVRKKVLMEHTVNNWRKQDKDPHRLHSFIPTPDDEVPFYSQIITGDKPIERHSILKEKIRESKFTKSPLKNVFKYEVIPNLGDNDFPNYFVVNERKDSGQRVRNIYPSTLPCHNIPPVVVSGIFESLMSELKLDLLGDCLDAIHDDLKFPID